MAHFDLFAAQAMLYFVTVSFAETQQRIAPTADVAWRGFLGVDDSVLAELPKESLRRLRAISNGRGDIGSAAERREFTEWLTRMLEPRNVAGLADAARQNMYPVDVPPMTLP